MQPISTFNVEGFELATDVATYLCRELLTPTAQKGQAVVKELRASSVRAQALKHKLKGLAALRLRRQIPSPPPRRVDDRRPR